MHGTCVETDPSDPRSGIGVETASAIVRKGAKVVLACRNLEKGKKLAENILEEARQIGKVIHEPKVMELDVASLDSVRNFAQQWKAIGDPIDVLINNAGIFNMGVPRSSTEDGYEAHLGTNYMGHVLLFFLLLPYLKDAGQGADARVIFVSSKLHKVGRMHFDDLQLVKKYTPLVGYSQSKLAQLLVVKHLRKVLRGNTGIVCLSLHPGEVLTDVVKTLPLLVQRLYRLIMQLFLLTPRQGCRSTVFAASGNLGDIEPAVDATFGYLGSDCRPLMPSKAVQSEEDAEELWARTLKELGMDSSSLLKEIQ